MCECCSGGKNTDKYKKFAFLNGHEHKHDQDHRNDHEHGGAGGVKITPVSVPTKKPSERP
jgi:hypothetical protein